LPASLVVPHTISPPRRPGPRPPLPVTAA
jgi:hypothetical protein